MECTTLQEDVLYSQNASKLTPESIAAIQNTVQRSQPVGVVAGLYDEALTITDVSGFFLKNLGYEYEDFCRVTGCSLRALFYGENQSFLAPERWPLITADGDGQLLTKDGVPIFARLYKMDSTNSDGTPIWILSAQMDWVRQNLHLVNSVMRSGIWYIDCDHAGSPTGVVYSPRVPPDAGLPRRSGFSQHAGLLVCPHPPGRPGPGAGRAGSRPL